MFFQCMVFTVQLFLSCATISSQMSSRISEEKAGSQCQNYSSLYKVKIENNVTVTEDCQLNQTSNPQLVDAFCGGKIGNESSLPAICGIDDDDTSVSNEGKYFYFAMYNLTGLIACKNAIVDLDDYSNYVIPMNSTIPIEKCCYSIIYVCPRKTVGNYTIIYNGRAVEMVPLDFEKTSVQLIEVTPMLWFPQRNRFNFAISFKCEYDSFIAFTQVHFSVVRGNGAIIISRKSPRLGDRFDLLAAEKGWTAEMLRKSGDCEKTAPPSGVPVDRLPLEAMEDPFKGKPPSNAEVEYQTLHRNFYGKLQRILESNYPANSPAISPAQSPAPSQVHFNAAGPNRNIQVCSKKNNIEATIMPPK